MEHICEKKYQEVLDGLSAGKLIRDACESAGVNYDDFLSTRLKSKKHYRRFRKAYYKGIIPIIKSAQLILENNEGDKKCSQI